MTDTDRAYEALGKTRSELARYKRQNAEQQKRIRQLEKLLLKSAAHIIALSNKIAPTQSNGDMIEEIDAAILKGKE